MTSLIRTTVFATFLGLVAGAAQAQVCVRIDEPNDTLSQDDRTAAVLLMNREFKLAGEPVVADCPTPYLLAHIKLGESITVLLTGPRGHREGKALGLDDLPPLYNQMVRSLITGEPMNSLALVDRTNATAAQATANRVGSDGFTYVRLGYGGVFAGDAYGLPSFGVGYRAELDRIAIDVSFLNFQVSDNGYDNGANVGSASMVKLSGLYLTNTKGNSTPYFGGGLSWGRSYAHDPYPTEVPRGPNAIYYYTSGGERSGLQGELTAGYEIGRATNIRMFVQADATLPFYSITSQTYSGRTGALVSTESRYTPTLVMSVGLGWGKNRSRK